jgi:tryptophan-rich sensory protein
MKKINWKRLIIALVLPQLAGLIGSLFTTQAIPTWYATLNRPSFAPPNWLFAPAWTLLFILMGIAFYLVWQSPVKGSQEKIKRQAIKFFLIQLVFNTLWSIIFFGQQLLYLAFVEIVILWILILLTILRFNKIKPLAAYLMIPYLLWVTFASVLNLGFALLN